MIRPSKGKPRLSRPEGRANEIRRVSMLTEKGTIYEIDKSEFVVPPWLSLWESSACQKSPKDSMSFRTSPQTGVGIPRIGVEVTGLGTKMFENPGDCARRKSPWGTTAVCALPRNDMVFRQSGLSLWESSHGENAVTERAAMLEAFMRIPPLVPSQSCCARQLPQGGAKGTFRQIPIFQPLHTTTYNWKGSHFYV